MRNFVALVLIFILASLAVALVLNTVPAGWGKWVIVALLGLVDLLDLLVILFIAGRHEHLA